MTTEVRGAASLGSACAATVVLALACGGAPPEGAAELPAPCSLLSAPHVRAATGLPFGEGRRSSVETGAGVAACEWVCEQPWATVRVLVARGGGSLAERRASLEELRGEPAVDLGLGEKCYRSPEGDVVAFARDGLFVQVAYEPSGPGEVAAVTLELARAVHDAL